VRDRVLPMIALVPLLVATRAIAEDATCVPTALVTGAPALADPVRTALTQRGILAEPPRGCPAVAVVHVRIDLAGTGLRVAIDDPDGRHTERVVSDAETAAALVDSWTRPGLGTEQTPQAATTVVDGDDGDIPAALAPTIIEVSQTRPISVAAMTTASVATDGALWLGLDAAACVRIGAMCVGAVVRTRLDTATIGISESQETSRSGVDLLIGADRPIALGRAVLRPSAHIGVGWTRSRSNASVATPDQQIEVDTGGIRLSASFVASKPVVRGLVLEFALGLDLSMRAHTGAYLDEGVTVAGESRGFLRAGVGLRYGAP